MFCDGCAWISVIGIGLDEKDEEDDDSHLLLTTSREQRCIGGRYVMLHQLRVAWHPSISM